MKKIIILAILVVIIATAVEVYFYYESVYPSTENAYIKADYVTAASLVDGKVASVYAHRNQHVVKGQILFKIDPKPYLILLNGEKAKVEFAEQQLDAALTAVKAVEAEVDIANYKYAAIQKDAKRVLALVKRRDLPISKRDDMLATLHAAESIYNKALFRFKEAKIIAGKLENNPSINIAKSTYKQAKYDLDHSVYRAPISGNISNMNLHHGDIVKSGLPLFVIVSDQNYWVDANFKETKLERIKDGQVASIEMDMYPGILFKGIVKTISKSSGSQFLLLPMQNPSANWVKVTQRFSVHINIIDKPKKYKLHVGASCYVRIDTNT